MCRLNLLFMGIENLEGPRLCAIVLMSSYFKEKVKYLREKQPVSCTKRYISFRTVNARDEVAGKLYFEFMAQCDVVMVNGTDGFYFISRAYNSNQVFVYSYNNPDGKLYIENLSTNVNIVDDYVETPK